MSRLALSPDGESVLVTTKNPDATNAPPVSGVNLPIYTVTLQRTQATSQAPILVITPVSIDSATGAVDYRVDIADPDGTGALPTVIVSELTHGSITDHGDGTVTYTPTEAARYAAGSSTATDADKFEYVTVTAIDPYGVATVVQVIVPISPLAATVNV